MFRTSSVAVSSCALVIYANHGAIPIKEKKALQAFFVPNEPAKPGIDSSAYPSRSLEVACILCHASKTVVLHPEFPVSKDEDQRRNDEDIDSWEQVYPRTINGVCPRVCFYTNTKMAMAQ